jgi:hypothetical protein
VSRNGRTLVVLSVALLAVAWVSASAETDVYAGGVIRGEYFYNTGYDDSVADTRLELDVGIGPVTLGAVYRAYQLSNPEYNPARIDVPEAYVKHRYLILDHEDLYAALGHFPATFGRGLMLRSYEDVDLEHDTLLDGIYAQYDAGFVGLTALSGSSREEDSGSRFFEHVVRGARASMPVAEWVEIAGSAVERSRIWEDDEGEVGGDFARFEDGLVGGEVSLWLGPVTASAEYVDRSGEYPVAAARRDPETDELVYSRDEVETRGHATYVATTVDLGMATLFGEFKDYDDFDHRMTNPPTCVREHLWTLMNRATYEVNLTDERGFLFEGSGAVGDAIFLTGGASEARSHNRDLRHWEMFGHATYDLNETVTLGAAAARSREYLFDAEGGTGKFTEHLTGVVDVDMVIGETQAVELSLEAQKTEDPRFKDPKNDYAASVTWYPGMDLTLSAFFEKTTDDWEGEGREAWTMLSARKSISSELEIEVAAGTERGGKKCAGGVCRYEESFEGVRLQLTKFF